MRQEKLALLIDAENISHKYIKRILKELEPFGMITYKRIYRDWTNASANGWKDVILENGLFPIQQYSYTSGKNATDFAIIIDAMDILHEEKIDIFCLATSDSDFTRLAMRLREAGKQVIGLGEKKTPVSFVASCEKYIYLDDEPVSVSSIKRANMENNQLVKTKNVFKSIENKPQNNISKVSTIGIVPAEKEIEQFSVSIVQANELNQKDTSLSELSKELQKRYPGFRPKNYNCGQLKKLISRFGSLQIYAKSNDIYVETIEKKKDTNSMNPNIEIVEREIVQIIQKNKGRRVSLGQLNQQLVEINKEYSYKRFGYSKFSKFVHEFNSIQLSKTPNGKEEVIVVSN